MNIFKKALCILMITVLVLTAAPLGGFAEIDLLSFSASASSEGDFGYERLSDGTYAVSDYYGPGGEVVIPGTAYGQKITAVGLGAFDRQDGITSITISEGIKSIGNYAFQWCKAIEEIHLPATLEAIGQGAFIGCVALKEITVSSASSHFSTDVSDVLFNKDKTRLVLYPAGNTAEAYSVPSSVTEIGYGAFAANEAIESVYIPDSVTGIEPWAFYCCSALKNVNIPKGLKVIDEWTFYLCESLESIVLPYGLTTLGNSAFYMCKKLRGIDIPSTVTFIDSMCFLGCEAFTSVTIPDSVKSAGYSVFSNCTNLREIKISESFTSFPSGLLTWCENIESVTIPDGITLIEGSAFSTCKSLKSIVIPDGVTEIGQFAFQYCESLESITIPKSVKTIGRYAFYNCDALKDVYYEGSSEDFDKISVATQNSDLTAADIHYGREPIPASASTVYKGVTATLDNDYFEKDSAVFNRALGAFCSLFTVIGYEKSSPGTIKKQLENCGFTSELKNIQTNAAQDSVNHFFAHKLIEVGGEVNMLVFAGFIGSHKNQWYSNFDPGTGVIHKGFNIAKEYMYDALTDYIAEKNIYDLESDRIKILITGHSRGAAVANLVAKDLIKAEGYAPKKNIYTYAFATPNSTSLSEAKNAEFKRIFNIVNPEDFVTKMIPAAWGYGRYGTTYTLPSQTNTKKSTYKKQLSYMKAYFEKLTGEKYKPYPDGEKSVYEITNTFTSYVKSLDSFYTKKYRTDAGSERASAYEFFRDAICPIAAEDESKQDSASAYCIKVFAFGEKPLFSVADFFITNQKLNKYFEQGHLAETYCAYMYTLSDSELTKKKSGYKGTVNCPVDVEIYDSETDSLAGRIVNNTVDEAVADGENSVVMYVDGDSKSFILPSDGDYEIKLLGNGDGKMDFSFSMLDSDIGETDRANYFDIEITKGLSMITEVRAEETEVGKTVLEKDNGDIIEPEEISNSDNTAVCEIATVCEGKGSATPSHTVKSGDRVNLSAIAEEGWQLAGWYENGVLVSEEQELSFVAKESRTLTAVFSHKDHTYEKTASTAPTCAREGKNEYRCFCGEGYTESIKATGAHTGGTATCKEKAKCSVCGTPYGSLSSANHKNTVKLNAKAPTYKESGLTEGRKCADCGKIILPQKSVAKKTLGKVKGLKVKAVKLSTGTKTTLTLSWSKVADAQKYEIYQQSGKKWKKIDTTSKTSLTVKKLKAKKTYKFRVRAIRSDASGAYSSVLTAKAVPLTTSLSLKAGKKQLTASWKTAANITGYEVQYSTSKKFSKKTTGALTVKKAKSKKVTVKRLTKGKKYYVRVRTFKAIGKTKVYSAWSTVKNVKVK